MAYIRSFRGKWRAEVQKYGQRISKVVDTEEDAQLWAKFTEQQLDSANARYAPRVRLFQDGPDLVTFIPQCLLDASREIPYTQTDVMAAAIPLRRASGVYFLLMDGHVVYVGQSLDVLGRVARHRREGKVFDAFAYMECNPADLDRLESLYIRAFLPPQNLSLGNHRIAPASRDAGKRAPLRAARAASEV